MKRKIKIFCLPSHQTTDRTSGVDMVRVIQPMNALNGYEDDEVKFQVDVWQIDKPQEVKWTDVAKKYDIIFLNYIANPWGFAGMGALARHYNRLIVLDTDDDLHSIMPDNPAFNVYKKGSDAIRDLTAIYNEVDYITTTNDHLKNVLLSHTYKTNNKIKILPNYIDLDNLYTHRSPFKDTLEILLYHFGSTTHFIDLEEKEFMKGIDMVFKDYPNVNFRTVGAFMPNFKLRWGQRYTNAYGDTDIYKWVREKFPGYMDSADIMVVPLAVNDYTKCKSSIKFLEAGSAKKPGVYQRMRQYMEVVEEGKNGFLASTAQEWYDALKKIIDNKELRRSMGEEAFKTVERDWQEKNHVKDRAEFFKSILTK